ncbi:MAG: phage holin family protein [Methanosarcina sp.]
MEEKSLFETLLEKSEDFSKTSLELLKLKAVDKFSDGASSAASKIAGLFFFLMFFMLLSVGLSLWLGDLFGKAWYGFFAMAGLYGILFAVLFFVKHNWLKKMVGNSIIKQMLN